MTTHKLFKAVLVGDHVELECDYWHYSSLAKQIPGACWDNVKRLWVCPATASTLEMLRGVSGARIDGEIARYVGTDFEPAPDTIPETMTLDDIRKRMPVRVKPYAHQAAAFRRAMEVLEG